MSAKAKYQGNFQNQRIRFNYQIAIYHENEPSCCCCASSLCLRILALVITAGNIAKLILENEENFSYAAVSGTIALILTFAYVFIAAQSKSVSHLQVASICVGLVAAASVGLDAYCTSILDLKTTVENNGKQKEIDLNHVKWIMFGIGAGLNSLGGGIVIYQLQSVKNWINRMQSVLWT